MTEKAFPICYSCHRYFDEEIGVIRSQLVTENKTGHKMCKECQDRVEEEQWPKR